MPAIDITLKNEGGFTSKLNDNGGDATNFGISLNFYRKKIKPDATIDDLRNLTINEASNIYEEYFWNRNRLSEIANQQLANKIFDLQVNTGKGVYLLQKAFNSISSDVHLLCDNIMGIKTLTAVNNANSQQLYDALIQQALALYLRIAAYDDNERFLKGWENRLYRA